MKTLYTTRDVQTALLTDAAIAVVGYGSQGAAQAKNLRDAGHNVLLGLRPDGASWARAQADGWSPLPVAEAVTDADVVVMLVADMVQPEVFERSVSRHLKPGSLLLFSHGFNVHYRQLIPPSDVDVALVAPKSPGALVRSQFVAGRGVPCLLAVHQDATGTAHERALAYAHSLGGTHAGVLRTTFAEETETDLFGEQAVLCGGVTELVRAGFETLVDAGYRCGGCLREPVDPRLALRGLQAAARRQRDRCLVTWRVAWTWTMGRNGCEMLDEIRSSSLREWMPNTARSSRYDALAEADVNHLMEEVGDRLRRARRLHDGAEQAEVA